MKDALVFRSLSLSLLPSLGPQFSTYLLTRVEQQLSPWYAGWTSSEKSAVPLKRPELPTAVALFPTRTAGQKQFMNKGFTSMSISYHKTSSQWYHPSALNKRLQKYKITKALWAVGSINRHDLGSNIRIRGVAYGIEETGLFSLDALAKTRLAFVTQHFVLSCISFYQDSNPSPHPARFNFTFCSLLPIHATLFSCQCAHMPNHTQLQSWCFQSKTISSLSKHTPPHTNKETEQQATIVCSVIDMLRRKNHSIHFKKKCIQESNEP